MIIIDDKDDTPITKENSYWTYTIVEHPKEGLLIMEIHIENDKIFGFSKPQIKFDNLEQIHYMITALQLTLSTQSIYHVDKDWNVITEEE